MLSARRRPSFTVSMLFRAEKLGQWDLRTKAIPGVGSLVLLTEGDILMVPTKAPIVYFQFLLPNTMKHPVTEWGRQLSYLLASKLKLALNLCKGIK